MWPKRTPANEEAFTIVTYMAGLCISYTRTDEQDICYSGALNISTVTRKPVDLESIGRALQEVKRMQALVRDHYMCQRLKPGVSLQ
jgi:hypothetical protein